MLVTNCHWYKNVEGIWIGFDYQNATYVCASEDVFKDAIDCMCKSIDVYPALDNDGVVIKLQRIVKDDLK